MIWKPDLPATFKKPTFNPVKAYDTATQELADVLGLIEQKHGNMLEVAFIRGSVYALLIEFGIPKQYAQRLLKRYPT